jgi:D-3-phosphoglycerate dehydrogenase / 2-oxoglutarate reductase
LTESGINAVAIEYEGAIAGLNVKPLTATALAGLLTPQLASVNIVNAPVICRERDIRVSETLQPEPGDYQMLMRLTVTGEDGVRAIAGTVFAGDKPRLVAVEGMRLEAELGDHVLFVRNLDKPGFIGALGTALAAASINIATFHLGRTAAGQQAICLVEIDQPLTPALLDIVRGLPNVLQVKSMKF